MHALSDEKLLFDVHQAYPQMDVFYDEKYKAGWLKMKSEPVPCFNPTLLKSLADYFDDIRDEMAQTQGQKYDFVVGASGIEGIYNLGGDLTLFSQAILDGDRQALMRYAISCIDVLYAFMSHLECELTTITLVKGDALGGGFEAAMSGNVLIAEEGCKLGLPEVLFNLFPGMGAYSVLSRKLGSSEAEKMIMSGELFSAEKLYDMGVVDILAKPGEGELEVYRYMDRAKKSANTHQAIRRVKDYSHAVSYEELLDITSIWVDSAMNLTARDLRMMSRLVKRQSVRTQV